MISLVCRELSFREVNMSTFLLSLSLTLDLTITLYLAYILFKYIIAHFCFIIILFTRFNRLLDWMNFEQINTVSSSSFSFSPIPHLRYCTIFFFI